VGIISPIAVDSRGNPIATGSTQSLGKDDFLKLLVTKLANQDPLNPMTDEGFVAELAQFSALEQMQNINDSLQNSLDWDYLQMQTINNTMATSLIGKEVRASYDTIYLDDGNSPEINYTTDTFARNINVTITDSSGAVVRRLTDEDIAAGSHALEWDGKDMNGNRLSAGLYRIKIEAVDGNGAAFTPSTYIEGKVSGVIYRDGLAYLHVNGLEIPLSDVTAIHEMPSEEEV
jgi:flagellar basal-body rod modification protein FlgD